MTIKEANNLGITDVFLKEWKKGYHLEWEREPDGSLPEKGTLYTPGDTDQIPDIIDGRLMGTKIVLVPKRKMNLVPYFTSNKYLAYETE